MKLSRYRHIRLEPTGAALGAEIKDLDLSSPLSEESASELATAHAEFGVLFFHQQSLTCAQHLRAARSLGEVNVNRFFTSVDGYDEIAEVRKEPDQTFNVGGGWHTDHSYDQIPALGSILLARETPNGGGDTVFASMYSAYDALSDGLKKTLSGLSAVHSSRHVFGEESKMPQDLRDRIGHSERATQDAIHPVVISHPISRRKALYVNPGFTLHFEGWTKAESAPLLNYLYEHATKPEFTYRFHWEEGSMAFWDNRSTWHFALNDYHGERRLMHRITLSGTPLSA